MKNDNKKFLKLLVWLAILSAPTISSIIAYNSLTTLYQGLASENELKINHNQANTKISLLENGLKNAIDAKKECEEAHTHTIKMHQEYVNKVSSQNERVNSLHLQIGELKSLNKSLEEENGRLTVELRELRSRLEDSLTPGLESIN